MKFTALLVCLILKKAQIVLWVTAARRAPVVNELLYGG